MAAMANFAFARRARCESMARFVTAGVAMIRRLAVFSLFIPLAIAACGQNAPQPNYDIIIRHGTVYDGTGAKGRRADVGIAADRIAAVGDLARAHAPVEIEARGLAVAPGFIN